MKQYLDLLADAVHNGVPKDSRAGPTRSLFGRLLRFDLSDHALPLVTTKHVSYRNILVELCWMIAGRTDIAYLHERNVHIWDRWGKDDGTIGPGYGYLWRHWPGAPYVDGNTIREREIDQLRCAIDLIRTDPNSRRILVDAWHPDLLAEQALPPCHFAYQFVVNAGVLHCAMMQRSADIFIGVPYNIAAYATLTHLVAHCTDLTPGELTIFLVDAHVYEAHVEAAKIQLGRDPRPQPQLLIAGGAPKDLFRIRPEHLTLVGYTPHQALRVPVTG